jgi:hypothetical protein
MTALHSNPRFATLKQSSALFRGEWTIHAATPCRDFIAFHEVREADGTPKIVEQIRLSSFDCAHRFVSYLQAHGWQQA